MSGAPAAWRIDQVDGVDPEDEGGDRLSEAMVQGAEPGPGKETGLTLVRFRTRLRHGRG